MLLLTVLRSHKLADVYEFQPSKGYIVRQLQKLAKK